MVKLGPIKHETLGSIYNASPNVVKGTEKARTQGPHIFVNSICKVGKNLLPTKGSTG